MNQCFIESIVNNELKYIFAVFIFDRNFNFFFRDVTSFFFKD